jgi:hypothetical protein
VDAKPVVALAVMFVAAAVGSTAALALVARLVRPDGWRDAAAAAAGLALLATAGWIAHAGVVRMIGQ